MVSFLMRTQGPILDWWVGSLWRHLRQEQEKNMIPKESTLLCTEEWRSRCFCWLLLMIMKKVESHMIQLKNWKGWKVWDLIRAWLNKFKTVWVITLIPELKLLNRSKNERKSAEDQNVRNWTNWRNLIELSVWRKSGVNKATGTKHFSKWLEKNYTW